MRTRRTRSRQIRIRISTQSPANGLGGTSLEPLRQLRRLGRRDGQTANEPAVCRRGRATQELRNDHARTVHISAAGGEQGSYGRRRCGCGLT
jgi:hypothetical protein